MNFNNIYSNRQCKIYHKNMFYDTNNLEYSMGDQEELLNLGNKLNRLFSQKASVEANIDFFNENRGGKNEQSQ